MNKATFIISAKRKATSKRLRFEVFKRDNFECQYCGAKPPTTPLEIDHVTPVSKQGMTTIDNLITACFDCNRGKSNIELNNIPPSLSTKLEMKKVAQSQYLQYKKILNQEKNIILEEILIVEKIYNLHFDGYIFGERFKVDVKNFIKKLGVVVVEDAMEIACVKIHWNKNDALKYFCGICYTRIKQM